MDNKFSGKQLLIVGAGVFQVPAIKRAKEMGLVVVTVDRNPNSIGFKFADHYEIVSTDDTESIVGIAKRYKIDGVMTLSTERAVVPAAYVAERCHLAGNAVAVALKATNKSLMRKAFRESNVPCPNFVIVREVKDLDEVEAHIHYPVMVKPSSGYASIGVSKAKGRNELIGAFRISKKQSADGAVVIEEFLEGVEVGGEAFVLDGKAEMIYITNKKVTEPPDYIPLGHSLPSVLPRRTQEKIVEIVAKGISSLGIVHGPVNFDVMVTREGPKVLEMGARLGGNCLPTIVRVHSGIDTIGATIALAMGEKTKLEERERRPVGVRILTSKSDGKIAAIDGVEEIKNSPNIVEICLLNQVGDTIKKFSSGIEKLGYVIATGESVENVETDLDNFEKKIKITLE